MSAPCSVGAGLPSPFAAHSGRPVDQQHGTSLMNAQKATRSDFRPSASLAMLQMRARMLDWTREFFRSHGYWEVETPVLSWDVCVDAWLEPFSVPVEGGGATMYLQTSPEFGMKRLLAAGADAIFQITRAYRQEETGRLHNPEFTMLEWYRVGDTYRDQMNFVEELTVACQTALAADCSAPRCGPNSLMESQLTRPFPVLTYEEAFARACGRPMLGRKAFELARVGEELGVRAPASLSESDQEGWLNLLFLEVVEPMLAEMPAVIVCDFPASQAALATVRDTGPTTPPVAERFELFLRGVEICNGYQELTDPAELRRRIAEQSEKRQRAGRPSLPVESRLLDAMEAGLPECSGVALGFDRLLMVLSGAACLADVMAFPLERA